MKPSLRQRLSNPRNRLVRIYDDGGADQGGTIDRYTAVYLKPEGSGRDEWYGYVGMSSDPFHPNGFGQHGDSDRPCDEVDGVGVVRIGRKGHLGKRIMFADLPEACQRLVLSDLSE